MSRDDKTPSDKTKADAPSPDKPGDPVRHFPAAGRGKACPICGKPVRLEFRPFCSKRCADIDLGRWLGEAYRIPAEEPPDGDSGEAADPGAMPPEGSPGRRGE